jgi:hypothetical protein
METEQSSANEVPASACEHGRNGGRASEVRSERTAKCLGKRFKRQCLDERRSNGGQKVVWI